MEERWNRNIREARMRMLVKANRQMEYRWLKFWAGKTWKELTPEIQEALRKWA